MDGWIETTILCKIVIVTESIAMIFFRYGHQYQYFQRIVAVYEREPDNFPRLMELMQDIQE